MQPCQSAARTRSWAPCANASGLRTIARHVGDNSHNPRRMASPSRTRAHFHRLLLLSTSVAALSALSAGAAAAQTWTGATSNDWTVGSNWSGGAAPTSGTNPNIVAGSTVVLGVNPGATSTTGNVNIRDVAGGTTSLDDSKRRYADRQPQCSYGRCRRWVRN